MAEPGQSLVYVERELAGQKVRERLSDKYFDASAMCKAAGGRKFNDWRRLDTTDALLEVLVLNTGIPVIELIQSVAGRYGGTWVHPKVAIAIAMWCSPEFHVRVIDWVYEGEIKAAATWTRLMAELDRRDDAIIQDLKAEMLAQRIEAVRLIKGATYGISQGERRKLDARHDRHDDDLTVIGVTALDTKEAIDRADLKSIGVILASRSIPTDRAFSNKCSVSLRDFCSSRGLLTARSPETRAHVFPSVAIGPWMQQHGNALIRTRLEATKAAAKAREAAAKDAAIGQTNLFAFPKPAS